MRSRIATFFIVIVTILIIAVFGIFGMIIWKEFKNLQIGTEVEGVKTEISENQNKNTIDKDIKIPEIIENPFDEIQDSTQNPSINVDYSNVTVDKYFYNQLEEPSKTIYKAFESNKENMKSGTYRIDLGNGFSNILNQANGSDLLGKYYQSAIEAYTYDNPEIFYLSPNKMYLNIETTTIGSNVTYNVFINNGNENNYFIDEFTSQGQVESAINQIEQTKNQILQNRSENTYDNIKMVHDYLVESIEYDTTISQSNIYNVYGALVNGRAVCEGYARSFKYLMDELGIPCTLVIGTGTNSQGETENHAWNYIQLNGNWYAIDCTWDDPVSSTGYVSQNSKYRYFLKGSNDFSKDHKPSGQFTEGGKVFSYPEISGTDF